MFLIENDNKRNYIYAYKNATFDGYSYETCPECGRQIATAQYSNCEHHLLLEGEGQYPDLLQFCGAGDRLFIVSEKTLGLFETDRITGFDNYAPIKIDATLVRKSTEVIRGSKPNYYSLNICGKIDLDLQSMQLKQKKKCSTCGQYEWNRQRIGTMVLAQRSWDGRDLCALASMPAFKLCTSRVAKIIEENRLRGFWCNYCAMKA